MQVICLTCANTTDRFSSRNVASRKPGSLFSQSDETRSADHASQVRHQRHQAAGIDRLGHVILKSRGECAGPVLGASEGGQGDGGCATSLGRSERADAAETLGGVTCRVRQKGYVHGQSAIAPQREERTAPSLMPRSPS
jgi:hypothetical protein